MVEFVEIFAAAVRAELDRHPEFRSIRSLAKAAGISYTQLSQTLNGQTKQGPSLTTICNLCQTLSVSPNRLLGFDDDGAPSFNRLVSEWDNGGERLCALDWASPFFDVYKAPTRGDTSIKILTLGEKSLARRVTGISNRLFFQATMDCFTDKTARMQIIDEYCNAAERGMTISLQNLHVPSVAHLRKSVDLRYQRLLLRATDKQERPVVINYSLPV